MNLFFLFYLNFNYKMFIIIIKETTLKTWIDLFFPYPMFFIHCLAVDLSTSNIPPSLRGIISFSGVNSLLGFPTLCFWCNPSEEWREEGVFSSSKSNLKIGEICPFRGVNTGKRKLSEFSSKLFKLCLFS